MKKWVVSADADFYECSMQALFIAGKNAQPEVVTVWSKSVL
jgi:hypothetical protein